MIRSLFRGRKKQSELPREHGPMQCAIAGAFQIDTLGIEAALASGEPAMGVPTGGPFIVAAVGAAQLDANTELTRYYDDDHRILQIMAPPGAGPDEIIDVSLYVPWDSVVPAGAGEWSRWTGSGGLIGAPEYDADGIHFARYWGAGSDHADLVEFVETVDDEDRQRRIHQRCMLYSRRVGSADEMLLLNIEKDLADSARNEGSSIEFLIGYGLGAADVQRV